MPRSKERSRRVPERSCVACRTRDQKRSLIRLVRTPDGQVQVDPTGRQPGRGAYLCAGQGCWNAALKRKALNRALRTVLTAEEIATLQSYAQTLPPSATDDAAAPPEPAAGTPR